MKPNKMREEMKEAFINALKEEKIPWQCDWIRTGRPENAVTGKPYKGVNSVWLAYTQNRKEYQDPRWCTFKQAQKEGWRVKKGEKGTRVEFWSLYDTETKQKISNGQAAEWKEQLGDDFYDRIKPISSVYTVFNAEQIEGIPERAVERMQPVLPEEALVEKRDILLNNMGLSFKEGGDEAFYSPGKDQITMPDMERFRNGYGYMSTFLHEAGHATSHESRLDRNIKNSFGTPDYAREELRAEIASAFTAQELGLPGTDAAFTNHKAYIQDWIMVLEKEPGELFAAIRDAEKIADYLMEKGEFELEKGKIEKRETEMDKYNDTQQDRIRTEMVEGLDFHISAEGQGGMKPEQLYQTMTPEMQQLYDMNRDFGNQEGMGTLLEEQKQKLEKIMGRQETDPVQEQTGSKVDYKLVQDVAEMEEKLNFSPEKRLTERQTDDVVFAPKKGIQGSDLMKRREEFQKHYVPLFDTQEAAKLRLTAKGRECVGFQPDLVHLKAAQMIHKYQEAGLDVQDIVSGRVEQIREAAGIQDPQYAKNLVCSIVSWDRQDYENYMGIRPEPDGISRTGRETRQFQAGQAKSPAGRARQAVRGGIGR